ncbi:MAG: type II toxin-antitoxin system VapC family toxin [Dolichospermum sp. DL01]|nr:MAG: type II toxin-antitoxin system VapC family toxin [Dolichospermum sp. DL01]
MIILDTHIWVWWVDGNQRLTKQYKAWIEMSQSQGIGVSIVSCWEVAKLVEKNRLNFSCPINEWLELALTYPGVQLLNLNLPIIVDSTKLNGFHSDPFDQMIVATARYYNFLLKIFILLLINLDLMLQD